MAKAKGKNTGEDAQKLPDVVAKEIIPVEIEDQMKKSYLASVGLCPMCATV